MEIGVAKIITYKHSEMLYFAMLLLVPLLINPILPMQPTISVSLKDS